MSSELGNAFQSRVREAALAGAGPAASEGQAVGMPAHERTRRSSRRGGGMGKADQLIRLAGEGRDLVSGSSRHGSFHSQSLNFRMRYI